MAPRVMCTLWVVALAACAELPVLAPDTCGNAVREGGEDCDLFADERLGQGLTCGNQCRYTCTLADPSQPCPRGWACGNDGTCRFGLGQYNLTTESPLPLATDTLLLGDVDADGAVDVVGGSASRLQVRFSQPSGGLRESFEISTDIPVGSRALARVGGGQQLDVLSPTAQGVEVHLGEAARRLVPAGFAAVAPQDLIQSPSEQIRWVALRPQGELLDAMLGLYVQAQTLKARVVSHLGRAAGDVLDLGPAPGALLSRYVPVERAAGAGQGVAVAVEGGDEVYVLGLQAAQVNLLDTVSVAHLGTVQQGVRWSDLDGDGAPDLLIAVRRPAGLSIWAVAWGQPDGSFARAEVRTPTSALCEAPGPCWPLAVGDIDLDGRAEFVLPTGIWTLSASTAVPRRIYSQLEPFAVAEILDINGDALPDVAATSDTRGVVRLLLNAGGLFNASVIDARQVVDQLRAGDFDGDGVQDLALVQGVQSSVLGPRRSFSDVSVVFGARSGPASEPILMARMAPIEQVVVARLPSSTLQNSDLIADLFVQVEDPDNGARWGLLTGTGQRRLHAPITLPDTGPSAIPSTVLAADFDDARDLVAFTFQGVVDAVSRGPFMYLLSETQGTYRFDDARRFSAEDSCLTSEMMGHGCLQAVSGRPFGRPGLVIVNRRADCPAPIQVPDLMLTLVSVQGDALQCEVLPMPSSQALTGEVRARLVDYDADGQTEVLALSTSTGSGATLLAWQSELESPDMLSPPDTVRAYDFAPLNADGDPALEVAVLGEAGVHIADWIDGRLVWPDRLSIAPAIEVFGPAARVQAADMDGDGLTDLVMGDADRLFIYAAQQSWLGGPPPEGQPAAASSGASVLEGLGASGAQLMR